MPVIKNFRYEDLPEWCELRRYERMVIKKGEKKEITTGFSKAAVMAVSGPLTITCGNKKVDINDADGVSSVEGVVLDSGAFTVEFRVGPGFWMDRAVFYVFSGDWQWAKVARFRVDRVDEPENPGDPADYFRNTCFDNHYHDYDEYWLLLQGGGVVQTEGMLYEVAPGDLVATKRGQHHDFPVAHAFTMCLGFKSRMGEPGRMGFNWVHTHGAPVTTD